MIDAIVEKGDRNTPYCYASIFLIATALQISVTLPLKVHKFQLLLVCNKKHVEHIRTISGDFHIFQSNYFCGSWFRKKYFMIWVLGRL